MAILLGFNTKIIRYKQHEKLKAGAMSHVLFTIPIFKMLRCL